MAALLHRKTLALLGLITHTTFTSSCLLQAALFNNEASGFDVLVASDAVGMGLNLNIRRIVFSSIYKFDGFERRMLTSSEAKQIAGRAGRFASQYPEGEVTCLEPKDLGALKYLLQQAPETIKEAGLFPTFDQLQLVATRRPRWSLRRILENFALSSQLSPAYFMQDCSDMVEVAEHLRELPLSLPDMYVFAISPVKTDDPASMGALYKFALDHLETGKVKLKRILNPGTMKIPKTQGGLSELESLHNILSLYLWLSHRLPDSFNDRERAEEQKDLCEVLIEEGLKVVGRPVSRSSKKKQMRPAVLGQPLLGIAQGVVDEPHTQKGSAKALAERKQNLLIGQTFTDGLEVSLAETRTSNVT